MDSKLKIPPEIINNQDTPEEYHFSNPSDLTKRNFWIGEDGHIHVNRKVERIMAEKFTEKMEDSE